MRDGGTGTGRICRFFMPPPRGGCRRSRLGEYSGDRPALPGGTEYSPLPFQGIPPGILLDRRQRTGGRGPLKGPQARSAWRPGLRVCGSFCYFFLASGKELKSGMALWHHFMRTSPWRSPFGWRAIPRDWDRPLFLGHTFVICLIWGRPEAEPPMISRQVRSAASFDNDNARRHAGKE